MYLSAHVASEEYVVPTVYAVGRTVIALEGQSINLRCLTDPSDAMLTWSFKGIDLLGTGKYAFSQLNHTLTMNTASVKDSGKYSCRITGTSINDTTTLRVKSGKLYNTS